MTLEYDLTNTLATFVICLLIILIVLKLFKERNYPPGPWGLPVLGYGFFLGNNPHKALRDLSEKYGGIFSLKVGSVLHICITDYYLAKEILSHPLALARPPHFLDFMIGRGGIGGMNGEEWQEQRRFAFYTMRNLGLGKGLWESMIQLSIGDFIEVMKNWNGKPIKIEEPLGFSQSSNNIALLIGRHFDKDKPSDVKSLEFVKNSTRRLIKLFDAVGLYMTMPWLVKFMETFHIGNQHVFRKLLGEFENIFRSEVEERLTLPDSLEKDDFIGYYFREMEKRNKDGKPHTFTLDNLMGQLAILFMAGNDSSLAGVSWLLILMASHPDIQKKVHDEIDAVVGREGVISYDIKNKMPYTMATLHEMTRFASISAIFPPRYALDTFTVDGYTIPRGCRIITNMWAIMRSPKYFKDPNEFQPQRFLDESGEKVLKLDGHAAFSFGKRNCPGEGIAIMSLFLYFVHIMQKFNVTAPPGVVLDLEGLFGGALLPKQQELCFIER